MKVRIQGPTEAKGKIYYEYDTKSTPLGQGGMGIVYPGYCCREDGGKEKIPVAVKLITNTSKDLIERAMREASIQIDHPNLVRMYGFIAAMEPSPDTVIPMPKYYVVMERLAGVTLDNVMNGVFTNRSGLSIDYASLLYAMYLNDRYAFVKEVMQNVLQAISALHKAGYIHRDIDPSNIMVTQEGYIKLIDFGISKTAASGPGDGRKLTQVGAVMGKVDYAAPELVTGDIQRHNVTTDIYSLGIMIYQLFTGALPFTGNNNEIMHAQLNDPVPVKSITDLTVRKIVEKATQKRQEDRYQSVDALLDDLQKEPSRPVQFEMQLWMKIAGAIIGLGLGAELALLIN